MKSLLAHIYLISHPNATKEQIPYWYQRTLIGEIWHLIRKKICVVWAPNCTVTPVRMTLYRICGFKIGKGTFIGMKCYLDDLCTEKITDCPHRHRDWRGCHSRRADIGKQIRTGTHNRYRCSV